MVRRPFILVCILSLTALACGNKGDTGEGSCDQVGVHFAALARAEAEKLPEDHAEKKAAMAQLAVLSKAQAALVKECRANKWSPEVRACVTGAKDAAEFRAKCSSLIARVAGDEPAPAAKEPAAKEPAAKEPAATDDKPEPPADDEPADGDDKASE